MAKANGRGALQAARLLGEVLSDAREGASTPHAQGSCDTPRHPRAANTPRVKASASPRISPLHKTSLSGSFLSVQKIKIEKAMKGGAGFQPVPL